MKRRVWIFILAVLLISNSVCAIEYYAIHDNNSPTLNKDKVNLIDLKVYFLGIEDKNFIIIDNSEIKVSDLINSVSVFIYEGNAIVIHGGGVSNEDTSLAVDVSEYLTDKSISNLIFSSNEILSDDLVDKIISIKFKEIDPKKEVTTNICSDTDNGRDYLIKGSTETVTLSGELVDRSIDTCFNSIDNLEQFPIECYDDTGTRGNGKCILETYCDEGHHKSEIVICASGCDDGKCLAIDSQPSLEEGPVDIIEDKILEDKEDESPEEVKATFVCNGCEFENKCYPYGFRKDGKYCNDLDNNFLEQKGSDLVCENNFECKSNICVSDQCVSDSLLRKIINWFKRVFGSN